MTVIGLNSGSLVRTAEPEITVSLAPGSTVVAAQEPFCVNLTPPRAELKNASSEQVVSSETVTPRSVPVANMMPRVAPSETWPSRGGKSLVRVALNDPTKRPENDAWLIAPVQTPRSPSLGARQAPNVAEPPPNAWQHMLPRQVRLELQFSRHAFVVLVTLTQRRRPGHGPSLQRSRDLVLPQFVWRSTPTPSRTVAST